MNPLLVFDMDGVLVDVTESYRETIARTAAHFTGLEVARERIQDYKNQGGFNDDWELTHRIIADAGVNVEFEKVKRRFQEIFLGPTHGAGVLARNGSVPAAASGSERDPLILRERWIARPGVLEKLSERFRLAVFTGRPREEAAITLNRFASGLVFDPIIAMEDIANHKPHPEGLLRILEQVGRTSRSALRGDSGATANPEEERRPGGPRHSAYYIGDTVDDAKCAREAGVPFIGIAAPSNPRYLDLVFLFQAEDAYAIVDDINYLDEVFAA